jgi:hypothetical protein
MSSEWTLLQSTLERVFADKPDTLAAVRRVAQEFAARSEAMASRKIGLRRAA